ncbi:MAG: hypothetical protein GYB32_08990 [Algicola sp.]|nr:hypothetical protein [Algicola sp.]
MKTIFKYLLLCFFVTTSAFAQTEQEKAQMEKYKEKLEGKKQAYIKDFIATLKVDDFQKEIITQSMDTYFDEVTKIHKLGLRELERKDAINKLDAQHFTDVKAIVSEDTMDKIMDAVKGEWDHKEAKKKQKRRKKNKN